jgi:hypothetical protein
VAEVDFEARAFFRAGRLFVPDPASSLCLLAEPLADRRAASATTFAAFAGGGGAASATTFAGFAGGEGAGGEGAASATTFAGFAGSGGDASATTFAGFAGSGGDASATTFAGFAGGVAGETRGVPRLRTAACPRP